MAAYLAALPNDTAPFRFREIEAMRFAVTEREKQAWYWFMETFVDCVAGKVQGGQQSKYLVPIRDSIITVSDEAFALLLLDNYETKWHAQHEHRTQAKTMAFIKMPRMHGKYTSKTMGQAEFCGWETAGTNMYTALCIRIQAERATPEGQIAEQGLLDHLQQTAKGQETLQKHARQQKRTNKQRCYIEAADAWHEL